MKVLVQRVKQANVKIEGKEKASINKGLLLFVGITKDDATQDVEYMINKVLNLRIFSDGNNKMNLDIQQVSGQILSVSQFTLCADMKKGNRPGFDNAASADKADELWKEFNQGLKKTGIDVKMGVFGALMEIGLINDGPVTIWLDSRQ